MELFRDTFVPNIQAAPYHKKWVAANSGEAQKWATYRNAVLAAKLVAGPAPTPPALSTRYGKALVAAAMMGDLLTLGAGLPPVAPGATTRRGQVSWAELQAVGAPAPPPPLPGGQGVDLPTRQVTLPAGATAFWLSHDSPNTQIVSGGNAGWRGGHRIIRWSNSPANSDPGLYSGRLMYAVLGFRLPLNGDKPGRMFDWHTAPDDDPWGWEPPGSGRVAPLAIDYPAQTGSNSGLVIAVQAEQDAGASNVWFKTIATEAQVEAVRGTWMWLWLETRWGRRDTVGFPGGVRVWMHNESSPRVDYQGINTHWTGEHMVTYWEGEYWSSTISSTKVVEIAATRFGTTPQKAYEDVPYLFSTEAAGNPGGSSIAIAPRLSTEASIPSTLQW